MRAIGSVKKRMPGSYLDLPTWLNGTPAWLAGGKNLKEYNKDKSKEKRASLTVDLPPNIRPFKDEMMIERSKLSQEDKHKSGIRYLADWPFVELRVDGQRRAIPQTTLGELVPQVIGMNHKYQPQ